MISKATNSMTLNEKTKDAIFFVLFSSVFQYRRVSIAVKMRMISDKIVVGNRYIILKAKLSPAQCGSKPKACRNSLAMHANTNSVKPNNDQ